MTQGHCPTNCAFALLQRPTVTVQLTVPSCGRSNDPRSLSDQHCPDAKAHEEKATEAIEQIQLALQLMTV